MRESKHLELKELVSNTFLKTVSAFANYGTGKILFGVRDDGTVVGIENPKNVCLDIENRINDSIDPVPDFTLQIDPKTAVITLTVFEGAYKPYLYKAKAYRRSDSATVPADRLALSRLVLEGRNQTFEEMPAEQQNLMFSVLENKLKSALHLQSVSLDTLKTLELYREADGYNHAAELLADQNGFSGIDMVRFGDSINTILDREVLDRQSILRQYDKAVEQFCRYYRYEQIAGSQREVVFLVPEEAFREAIANALVHRTWDIDTHINVGMFPNRIEITSPGGLPNGIQAEEYHRGGISLLRNRIIAGVFYRLRLIEHFGTGIRRIRESYRQSAAKPTFDLTECSIRVILPVLENEISLSKDEAAVFAVVSKKVASSSMIAQETGFGKSKVLSILKRLSENGYIQSVGTGRGTQYSAIQ